MVSISHSATSSMMPLGMLVFGPVADIIRIEWLLLGTGALLFAQSLFVLGNRALIEAGKPTAKAEPPVASPSVAAGSDHS